MKTFKNSFFVLLLFISVCGFAQKFHIKSNHGNIFYLDEITTLTIDVEGYDTSEYTVTTTKPNILKNRDDKYIVNLRKGHLNQSNIGEIVTIGIWIKKEKGGFLLGKTDFIVARKNDFEMGLGTFRSGDNITKKQFQDIDEMSIASDDAVSAQNGKGFKVIRFESLAVPHIGNAEGFSSIGGVIPETMKEHVNKLEAEDRILFDDIILKDENGTTKRGSSMYFIISENRGTYLYPFYEKDTYTIDELLAVETLTAQVGSDAPNGGEVFPISGIDLLIIPKIGGAEGFSPPSSWLTSIMKNRFKNLKPGDKILINSITYTRPDGTFGKCPPAMIFIR